ncbi:unnamed protein product [Rhodiola kirilowii]
MSTAKLTFLDGSNLTTTVDLSFSDSDVASPLTGPQVLQLAESRASACLLDASLPEPLKAAARRRIAVDLDDESFRSSKLAKDAAAKLLERYISAIADELEDNPVASSTLDGAPMKLFLDDEDDFAMLAENLFTDLDTEDVGKVQKSMVRDALETLGVDFGIPPFVEFPMLNEILKKHGAEGEEEFGQAQFAEVLQLIMQELANYLAGKPIVVIIQNVKVNNGSVLRKLLANTEQLGEALGKVFEEMSKICEIEDNTELHLPLTQKNATDPIRSSLEKYGELLGLPPPDANDAVQLMYEAVFDEVCNRTSTNIEKSEVHGIIERILEKFAKKLEANPVLYELY